MTRRIFGPGSVEWCDILLLITAVLYVTNIEENSPLIIHDEVEAKHSTDLEKLACDEFYVVREGETIYSIADKCNDPFIFLWNPHIQDPDDVFPGRTDELGLEHVTPCYTGYGAH
ncbi:LysM domain [Sesbania bispinosa]|nr:LysM domain [Sesbania bispinosa]